MSSGSKKEKRRFPSFFSLFLLLCVLFVQNQPTNDQPIFSPLSSLPSLLLIPFFFSSHLFSSLIPTLHSLTSTPALLSTLTHTYIKWKHPCPKDGMSQPSFPRFYFEQNTGTDTQIKGYPWTLSTCSLLSPPTFFFFFCLLLKNNNAFYVPHTEKISDLLFACFSLVDRISQFDPTHKRNFYVCKSSPLAKQDSSGGNRMKKESG